MKKLMYLLVAGTMFAFTACGGGETTTEEAAPSEEAVAVCANTGVPCLDDHSCCATEVVSDTVEATEEVHDHEEHSHDHEEHSHDH